MLYIFSFFKIEICNLQFCFYVPLYIIKLIIPQSVLNSSSLHIKCFSYWEKKKKSLNFVPIKTKESLILTAHTFAHFKVPPSFAVSEQPSFRILLFKMLMTSSS